jgi:pimeloyl-ACP methyl ester carboxylesterase
VVVLIHGLGSDSSSWQLQMDTLGKLGYRPVAVDIPGFGRSPFSGRRWTIRRSALAIINLVIEPLPKPIILVGLSLGGVIAQKILQYRQNNIEKIILISTFSRLRPRRAHNLPYLGRRLLQIFSGNLRKQAMNVADHIFPYPEQKEWHDYLFQQVKEANPRVYRQAMVGLGTFNSARWMRKIEIPCLIISGAEDNTVSLLDQKRLARLIKGSKHIIVEHAGHAVTIDHSSAVNDVIKEFLQENILLKID